MSAASPTVAELGETATLARILPHFRSGAQTIVGPGDDCAVVRFGGDAVVTTDTMFEGTDFRLDWHRWEELGHKAVVTNLSDVESMGAVPTALTLALGVPGDTAVADLEAFARGAQGALAAQAPGAAIVGGDLSESSQVTIAVTAMGELRTPPVLRSGARPGDVVVVAGELGRSGEGLALLAEHGREAALGRDALAVCAHLTPEYPVGAGLALAEAGASAMMDVSDGLALDATRLAKSSGVTLDLDTAALDAFAARLEAVLFGGEDHALLATLPASAHVPAGARVTGRVVDARPDAPVTLAGDPLPARGWDPFAR